LAFTHQPEPELPAVGDDNVDKCLPVHPRRLERRAPPFPQDDPDADVAAESFAPVGAVEQRLAQRQADLDRFVEVLEVDSLGRFEKETHLSFTTGARSVPL
jgi:hypothetical protein